MMLHTHQTSQPAKVIKDLFFSYSTNLQTRKHQNNQQLRLLAQRQNSYLSQKPPNKLTSGKYSSRGFNLILVTACPFNVTTHLPYAFSKSLLKSFTRDLNIQTFTITGCVRRLKLEEFISNRLLLQRQLQMVSQKHFQNRDTNNFSSNSICSHVPNKVCFFQYSPTVSTTSISNKLPYLYIDSTVQLIFHVFHRTGWVLGLWRTLLFLLVIAFWIFNVLLRVQHSSTPSLLYFYHTKQIRRQKHKRFGPAKARPAHTR